MAQIWVDMIHYLLVAYLQFLHKFNLTPAEIMSLAPWLDNFSLRDRCKRS
jgi:hypothetical protein